MKTFHKITLALAILCVEQTSHTRSEIPSLRTIEKEFDADNLQSVDPLKVKKGNEQKIDHKEFAPNASSMGTATTTLVNTLAASESQQNFPKYQTLQEADRLVQQAYITPSMQWTILEFCEHPYVMDLQTRMPVLYDKKGQPIGYTMNTGYQVMPTVKEILVKTTGKLSPGRAAQAKKVLQTTLQAIKLAMYVAEVEASYDSARQNYYFYQTADGSIMSKLDGYKKNVEAAFGEIEIDRSQGDEIFTYKALELDNPDHVMIKPESIITFLDYNDFKQIIKLNGQVDYHHIANLLIKQAFIAQQLHLQDAMLEKIPKAQHDQLAQIYKNFPDFYALVELAKNMPEKKQQNKMFKHIRQAVLTAMCIASQNSDYYITTDPLIKELKILDNKVKELCNNPFYGATPEDIKRDAIWTNLTNVALGFGALAATGAAMWAYNDPKGAKNAYNQYVQPSVDYVQDTLGLKPTYMQQVQNKVKQVFTSSPKAYTSPTTHNSSDIIATSQQQYKLGSGAKEALTTLGKHQFEKDIIQDDSYATYLRNMLPQFPNQAAARAQESATAHQAWNANDFL